ncbi:response regulator transcription factor [Hydrogenophaga sp.]|uniref:response regulator transcription factor n=1 Tax=Hydrogenophaga sp. TaxID=1904254 RepID=UPI003918C561
MFPVWNVLIVEDDAQMREFFACSVARSDSLALLASVGTVAEAMTCLDQPMQRVDVLLTDLGLPDGSGLDVIRHARLRHPECEALVISMFGDEDNVMASIEAGALGYIHKDTTPEDVAQTILGMKAGASPISPMIARRVLAKYRALQAQPPVAPASDSGWSDPPSVPAGEEKVQLSNREQEVLELIARGFSYAEIARLKAVSVHTVQTHIKNLYSKLAVHSKSEAVFEATRMGLLPRGY